MRYSAIDLFAGCGGLSDGFHNAGFDIIAQIDMDKWACESLRTRHLFYELKARKKNIFYTKYLKGLISKDQIIKNFPDVEISIRHRVIQGVFGKDNTDELISKIEKNMEFHCINKVNVFLGGPPCQPYSLIGRARDQQRMQYDERHFLYTHYLNLIEHFQPDFFIYENVPGLFSAKANGQKIFLKILEDFASLQPSYEITPPLEKIYEDPHGYVLNSADFFIPQNRKRLVLIGYRSDLYNKNQEIKDIFKKLQESGLENRKRGFFSVKDAIGDLPELKPGEGDNGFFGAYSKNENLSVYQKKMRKFSPGILNHMARTHMQSDIDRYRFFIEHHQNGEKSANLIDLIQKRPDLIPQHKHLDKFVDRFKVQWWTRPSSTITAHISKDGHYFIHPDIDQCRSFTVREAARCQSFPDNFFFEGPRTEQFRQVGNAVPPLLAEAIGRAVIRELEKIY